MALLCAKLLQGSGSTKGGHSRCAASHCGPCKQAVHALYYHSKQPQEHPRVLAANRPPCPPCTQLAKAALGARITGPVLLATCCGCTGR